MTILLDTHAFLWWVDASPRLSTRARAAIAEPRNEVLFSLVSCWELAIKISTGKLKLKTPLERFVPDQLVANGFRLAGLELRHVAPIAALTFHHRDPFDRLLATQALEENWTIVSHDRIFRRYGVARIW